MTSLSHLVASILKIGMILGVSGGLYRATAYLKKEAFESTQHGLVSLGHLNRQLNLNSHVRNKIKAHPKTSVQ